MEKTFNNYEELFKFDRYIAREILEEVGEGQWQNEPMRLHDDVIDFAKYELTEGWYTNLEIMRDWNGAPNPFDYINFAELGHDLVEKWDGSMNHMTSEGKILISSYGW